MAFELIPFPLSILFGLVFAVAWMVVLWKLRRKGKIYSILFKVNLIAGLVLFAAILYTILTNLLG
jgi:4-hydroxybenzoate polyprenyltransferase